METGLVTRSNIQSSLPQSGESLPPGPSQWHGRSSGGAGIRVTGGGDRRAEYLLVIYPYGELRDRLLEEQQQFSSDYEVSVRNRPHITMAVFQAAEGMEDTLIRWIQRICQHYQRFELTLNNYSGIPPHTIYLRVQDPQPFKRLMQQLKAIDHYVRSSGCPPINLIDRPYLSIAGGLTEQVYNKAMPDYSRKTFHESLPVDELVLLKRNHQFDPCRTVNIFRLQSSSTNGAPAGTLPHL